MPREPSPPSAAQRDRPVGALLGTAADDASDDEIEARKEKAERGWLADPPPPPPRAYIPGEENKWFLMMGARDALERKRKREQGKEDR